MMSQTFFILSLSCISFCYFLLSPADMLAEIQTLSERGFQLRVGLGGTVKRTVTSSSITEDAPCLVCISIFVLNIPFQTHIFSFLIHFWMLLQIMPKSNCPLPLDSSPHGIIWIWNPEEQDSNFITIAIQITNFLFLMILL